MDKCRRGEHGPTGHDGGREGGRPRGDGVQRGRVYSEAQTERVDRLAVGCQMSEQIGFLVRGFLAPRAKKNPLPSPYLTLSHISTAPLNPSSLTLSPSVASAFHPSISVLPSYLLHDGYSIWSLCTKTSFALPQGPEGFKTLCYHHSSRSHVGSFSTRTLTLFFFLTLLEGG